jgi:hypothetical protein
MKSGWKRLFFWSSLGGVAVGTAVALARKARPPQLPLLEYERIPLGCQRASLWTEQYSSEEGDGSVAAQDKYVLQVTTFKVWSVVEAGGGRPGEKPEGTTIYHVTHLRYAATGGVEGYPDDGRLQDRFYGTIAVVRPDGRLGPRNCVARGAILEINKCLVGGGSNGIETGEVHHSASPILNYRFEYSAR